MNKVLVEELDVDINAARDKIKEVDEQIGALGGRAPRARISYTDSVEVEVLNNSIDRRAFGLEEKRITSPEYRRNDITDGAIRRRTKIEDRIERKHVVPSKRLRTNYLEDDDDEIVPDDAKKPRKSIQSTVVMPALDSKGREEKIEKLKEAENKEIKSRNRRMFSNLLIGTLNTFKKTEKKTQQQERQEEVEKKLEEVKKKDEEQRNQEKHNLISKRREQEKELQGLQRKKALIQYAEIKCKQLSMMKGAIKTVEKPEIYWQPVKHTVRSMELEQNTERYLEELIKVREQELQDDLAAKERRLNESENNGNREEESAEKEEYEDDEEKNEEDGEEGEEEEGIEVVLKDEGKISNRTIRMNEVQVELDEEVDVQVELD